MISKLKRYFTSLKFMTTVLILAVGLIPIHLATWAIGYSYYTKEVSDRLVALQNSCVSMADQLDSRDFLSKPDDVSVAELRMLAEIYGGRVQIINSDYRIITDTYRINENRYCTSAEVIRCFAGKGYSNTDRENRYIEYLTPIKHTAGNNVVGVMAVSASIDDLVNRYEDMSKVMVSLRFILTLIVVILAFVLPQGMFRPFRQLSATLTKINEGNTETEIFNNGYTEIKDINSGYSNAISKLREVDESRQEFVSNVSHELKTPITSIKVLVDSMLSSESMPEEVYRDFLGDISNEVNRENDIINDLLAMVRLDKGSGELNLSSVNINDFIEDILRRLKPIAAVRNIELTFETFRPITAEIDEVKLSLAIMNLVENAIKYNVDSGWVKVSINADHKYFYVDVSDSGIGIPEEYIGKIFERFYRVDKARSRETGGTGLGLSITKKIVVMHNGTISVTSKEGSGTQFVVRIPL